MEPFEPFSPSSGVGLPHRMDQACKDCVGQRKWWRQQWPGTGQLSPIPPQPPLVSSLQVAAGGDRESLMR